MKSFQGKIVKMAPNIDTSFKLAVEDSERRIAQLAENIRKEQELINKNIEKKIEKKKEKEKELRNRQEDFELEFSSEASSTEHDTDDNIVPEVERDPGPPVKNQRISGDTKVALHISLDDVLKEWVSFLTRYKVGKRCEAAL